MFVSLQFKRKEGVNFLGSCSQSLTMSSLRQKLISLFTK